MFNKNKKKNDPRGRSPQSKSSGPSSRGSQQVKGRSVQPPPRKARKGGPRPGEKNVRTGGLGGGRGPTRLLQTVHDKFKNKREKKVGPASLPKRWEKADKELEEKKKRWAKFAGFLSKEHNYTGIYKKDLQSLDSKGCINLKRLTRQQWVPGIELNYVALVAFCPYEGLEGELSISDNGINVVDDAVLVAQTFLERGYRVVYIQDPTADEFVAWYDFFLEEAEKEIVVYFSGYGKKFIDYSFNTEVGEVENCLLLYNEDREKNNQPLNIETTTGVTEDTISEDYLLNNIAGLDYPEKKVTIYFDLYQKAGIFEKESDEDEKVLAKVAAAATASASASSSRQSASVSSTLPGRVVPPENTFIVDFSLDVDEVLEEEKKQAAAPAPGPGGRRGAPLSKRGGRGGPAPAAASKGPSDNSSILASTIANQTQERGFFSSLASFVSAVVSTLLTSSSSSVSYSAPAPPPPETKKPDPITQPQPVLKPQEVEPPLPQIIQTLQEEKIPINTLTELPPPELSPVEVAGAETRWKTFTEEMKKPATYTSEYKKELQELDRLGAINLDRITRAQIPDIQIDRAVALFFNPYEGLPHTLDAGPVNDAITMATLFINRGYRVVYLCDGTPKEYYIWMDWLLDNVNYEIVTYFSGHGTQVVDRSGKEEDGLSEVYVFYDESKKGTSQAKKVKAQTGITENTISDDLLHELIVSKQYPETRLVLISDCCHSGTMFDFDEPLPPDTSPNEPPLNVVTIGAAKDEQTAKQTVLAGKESGIFTYNFSELLKTNKNTTFAELQTFMDTKIKKYQTIQICTTDPQLLREPIVVDADKLNK